MARNMKENKKEIERKEHIQQSIEFHEKRLEILYKIYEEEFENNSNQN